MVIYVALARVRMTPRQSPLIVMLEPLTGSREHFQDSRANAA
ncbi:MAG: hypothetical protein ABSB32_09010 [Thermodesulfobacteriota bacterium]